MWLTLLDKQRGQFWGRRLILCLPTRLCPTPSPKSPRAYKKRKKTGSTMKSERSSNRSITKMLTIWSTLISWFLEIHWEAPRTKVTLFNFQYRHRKILLGSRETAIDPLTTYSMPEHFKQGIATADSTDEKLGCTFIDHQFPSSQ